MEKEHMQDESSKILHFKHLVLGSGGSRTILAGAGALKALEELGISRDNWTSIGGISGGAIVALLYAAGATADELIDLAENLEFSSLLERTDSKLSPVAAVLLGDLFWSLRPRNGALSTEKLGAFIKDRVDHWPERFWTMAVTDQGPLLFQSGMISAIDCASRSFKPLFQESAPVDTAIRGTCTVPGLMTPPAYRQFLLFDGVLSPYGSCPTALADDLYPGERQLGVDAQEKKRATCRRSLAAILQRDPAYLWKPLQFEPADSSLVINPDLGSLPGLDFKFSKANKWAAITAGYAGTLEAILENRLLEESCAIAAREKLNRLGRCDFKNDLQSKSSIDCARALIMP